VLCGGSFGGAAFHAELIAFRVRERDPAGAVRPAAVLEELRADPELRRRVVA
jgi:hypothetical protein